MIPFHPLAQVFKDADYGKVRHILFAGLLLLGCAAVSFLYEVEALNRSVAEEGHVAAIRTEKHGDYDVPVYGISAPSFGSEIRWQTIDRADDLAVGSRLQIVRSPLYFRTGYRLGRRLDEFQLSFALAIVAAITIMAGPPFLYVLKLTKRLLAR